MTRMPPFITTVYKLIFIVKVNIFMLYALQVASYRANTDVRFIMNL
jgi:hypothetical protein